MNTSQQISDSISAQSCEKYRFLPGFRLISILFPLLALALQACGGGSSGSNFEQEAVPPIQSAENGTDPDPSFGSDGVAAFRLLSNNNGFDLNEGEAITLPVSLQRVNGHQSDITLSVSEASGEANSLLQVALTANQLFGDDVQTTPVSYTHLTLPTILLV